MAKRAPSQVGVTYHASTQALPGNSGLTGVDQVADRAIGLSAHAGWEVARRRRADKLAELQANPSARPEDLRNLKDHYEVMPKEESDYRERVNKLVNPIREKLVPPPS